MQRIRIVLGEFFVRFGFRLMGFSDIASVSTHDADEEEDRGHSGPVVTLSPKAREMRAEASTQRVSEPDVAEPPLRGSLADRLRIAKGA